MPHAACGRDTIDAASMCLVSRMWSDFSNHHLAPSKLLQTRASFVHNVPQTLFSMLSMHRLAIVFLPATMEAALGLSGHERSVRAQRHHHAQRSRHGAVAGYPLRSLEESTPLASAAVLLLLVHHANPRPA